MCVLSTTVAILAFLVQQSSGIIVNTFNTHIHAEVNPFSNNGVNNGRRRLVNEDGEVIDPVCVRTMELVRELSELGDILWHPGMSNGKKVRKAAKVLMKECMRESKEDFESQMEQCEFYVRSALELDADILESVWLYAYGDNGELHRGCGKVVTTVNENMRRRAEVEIKEVNGVESFVQKDNVVARRLLGAASAAAVGAGVVLGHLCRHFDPTTFDVLPLGA